MSRDRSRNRARGFSGGGVERTINNLATYDLDFANNTYKGGVMNFSVNDDNNLLKAYVNFNARTLQNADGTWSVGSANRMKRTTKGIWILEGRTTVVLWPSDFTNAAWTKTNMTATKNQPNLVGTANQASSLTATASDATVLQAITLASSQRYQSAFVKRLSGTGPVYMTMDGGSNWTDITSQISGTYSQVIMPTSLMTDPNVGFKIATSGDSIAVDCIQNENGDSPTPHPMYATTASVQYWQERAAAYRTTTTHDFPDFIQTRKGLGFYYELSSIKVGAFNHIAHSSTPSIIGTVEADGSVVFASASLPAGTFVRGLNVVNKIAGFKNANGDYCISCNGVVSSVLSGSVVTAVDHMDLCNNGAGVYNLHGVVKRAAYFYPDVITPDDLLAFTTL